MTILILLLMLLSVNTLFLIRVLTTKATDNIRDQIDVSIYFDPTASKEQIEEVSAFVSSFPEVIDATSLTSDEVLQQFREQHKDNPHILASLDELEENPLGSTMIIRTKEPADYQKIIAALSVPEYQKIVEAKTFGDTEKAIERIDLITQQIERLSLGVTLFFGLIAFLIIFNTIRIAIYTHRIEIAIKKLVGASNWFVRGPYIVESFLLSMISVAITIGLVFLATRIMDPYLTVVFGASGVLTDYLRLHFVPLVGIQFFAVLLLTLASSMLAMRRYLRA